MARSPPCSGESASTVMKVNYQLLAVILLKQPNWQLLVAVDHNQLRTMAPETIQPIDCGYPFSDIRTVQIGATSAWNRTMVAFRIRSNNLAYAATQDDELHIPINTVLVVLKLRTLVKWCQDETKTKEHESFSEITPTKISSHGRTTFYIPPISFTVKFNSNFKVHLLHAI